MEKIDWAEILLGLIRQGLKDCKPQTREQNRAYTRLKRIIEQVENPKIAVDTPYDHFQFDSAYGVQKYWDCEILPAWRGFAYLFNYKLDCPLSRKFWLMQDLEEWLNGQA